MITFSVNGLNYACEFFPNDAFFFRIMLPQIDNRDVKEVRDVIAEINSTYKVAKIIEVANRPWIVAESFAYSKVYGERLMARLVKVLEDVYNAYREKTLQSRLSNNVEA